MNKVILIGIVGQDPEVRNTPSGAIVANFSLATSKKYKGEQQTEWHRIVCFNKTAEIVESYVKKGTRLALEGELSTQSWEDKQGNKRSTTKIVSNSVEFIGGDSTAPRKETKTPIEEFEDDIPF